MNRKCSITLSIFLLFQLSVSAANLYVSVNKGNDSNRGLSETTPFKTIQKAADITNPGDTVNIMDGTYSSNENPLLKITRPGQEGKFITFRAMKGHKPKLTVSGSAWDALIMNASYIILDGLELEGNNANLKLADAEASYNEAKAGGQNWSKYAQFNTNGITFGGNESILPSHLIIRNCSVHDFPGGGLSCIKIDYLIVENNKIYNNGWFMMYAGSGISLFHLWNSDNNTTDYKNIVRGNLCYNNRTNVKWVATGNYSDGNGIIIDDNKNVQNGAPPGGAYKGKTLVENNISFNNGGAGIIAFSSSNVDIVNNTAYNNGTKVNYAEIVAGDCTNVNLVNNIMFARTGGKVNDNSNNINVVYDYNLYFNGQIAVNGPHDAVADPKFVNPDIDPLLANFHLKSGSPAIDSGNSLLAAKTDFDSNIRPSKGTADIGAYEYTISTGASIQNIPEGQHLKIYPNPANDILFVYRFTEKAPLKIEIYNSTGSLVYEAIPTPGPGPVSEINISFLKKGLYLVKTDGNETDIRKIVKL